MDYSQKPVSINKNVPDMVNHPPHYNSHPSGVECIEITKFLPAPLSNAFKYIFRCDGKGNPKQDLKKALFYIKEQLTFPPEISQYTFNIVGGQLADKLDKIIRAEENKTKRRIFTDFSLLVISDASDSHRETIEKMFAHVCKLIESYENTTPPTAA